MLAHNKNMQLEKDAPLRSAIWALMLVLGYKDSSISLWRIDQYFPQLKKSDDSHESYCVQKIRATRSS
jgi:hypothetical protein